MCPLKVGKSVYSIIFALLVSLVGCNSESNNDAAHNEKYYYDLSGLLNKEIVYLSVAKPTITKLTGLNGEKETIKTAQVDWNKELELFNKLDINKPAYKNSYTTQRVDSLTTAYALIPSEKLTVRNLIIQLDSNLVTPSHIYGDVVSENKLYESTRKFSLHFSNGHLASYTVEGYQKLMFMDKRPFQVSVTVHLAGQ